MDLQGKNILVVGLARTGIATVKQLVKRGANVTANDIKLEADLDVTFSEIKDLDISIQLGKKADTFVERQDLIVVSPGVPTSLSFFRVAEEQGVNVIGEIELAYILCKAPIVAITGTNGKTTTTSLVGDIFKRSGKKTFVVGNIGSPFINIVDEAEPNDIVVLEISSFQLETIETFKPMVGAILNITPDHLDRHGSFEDYCAVKGRLFENMSRSELIVYNINNAATQNLVQYAPCRRCGFGLNKEASTNAWVSENKLITNIAGKEEIICEVEDIFIPGEHNVENALAAVLIAKICGVSNETIATSLKTFRGVAHRIEYVAEIHGVTYYNDSKGTNPESVIKAIQAMKRPTVLIAGGYDKQANYSELMEVCKGVVKQFVLIGETASKIRKAAEEAGFNQIDCVDSLEQAVKAAKKSAQVNETVLLSPACASWDMFKDYEQRGDLFKKLVIN